MGAGERLEAFIATGDTDVLLTGLDGYVHTDEDVPAQLREIPQTALQQATIVHDELARLWRQDCRFDCGGPSAEAVVAAERLVADLTAVAQ